MPAPVLLALALAAAGLSLEAEWQPLFNGKTLEGWRPAPFRGAGTVGVEDGYVALGPGSPMTGLTYPGPFPKTGYEIRYEAARLAGNDFFASLTFPVGESFCTFIVGGWGGDIVGLSSIDGWDASDNETRTYVNFVNGKWYRIRLRVTTERIEAWIDDQPVVSVDIRGRSVGLRPGDTKLTLPLGFFSYRSKGGIRKVEYRTLAKPTR